MSEKLNLKNALGIAKNAGGAVLNRLVFMGAYADNADKYGPAANITIFEAPTPPIAVEGVGIPERTDRNRAA